MSAFLKLVGTLALIVVLPLAIILGLWAGFLPESLQVGIGMFGVYAAIAFIVVGHLYMIWDDIRSKRYSQD